LKVNFIPFVYAYPARLRNLTAPFYFLYSVIAVHIWLQQQRGEKFLPTHGVIDGKYPNVISLEEAVERCKDQGWTLPFTKQVPDDYDPTEEIVGQAG
jgi:hypothetical protein